MSKQLSMEEAEELQILIMDTALKILKMKRKDYSGTEDPFRNFRTTYAISGVEPWRGVLVRLGDKFSRIRSIMEAGGKAEVVDETLLDTFADILNYTCIMAGLCDEEINWYGKLQQRLSQMQAQDN